MKRLLQLTILLVGLLTLNACSYMGLAVGLGTGALSSPGTVQANSRSLEELYLSSGEPIFMLRYGDDLLNQGRYREAFTAYYGAEQGAYTVSVRESARARRMYVQELIIAYENGATPQPPPVIAVTSGGASQVPPKARYDGPYAVSAYLQDGSSYNPLVENPDAVSVVAVDGNRTSPSNHYYHQGGAYNLYGHGKYPGDIRPEEVHINNPPPTPRNDEKQSTWYNPNTWWE